MRNKILEIIERENRKLNPMEIMSLIKKESTVDDYRELMEELESLCRDGILRTASGNTYVKNELLTGIIDMHEKGNAHLLVPGGEDIFIARNNMNGAHDKDFVSIDITSKEKGEGKVVKVLKRSLGRSLAEVVNVDGNLMIKPLDENLPYTIVVDDTDLNLVDGLYVHLEYVKDLGKGRVLARIDRTLGHKNALVNESGTNTENATRIAQIAYEFGIPLEFSEECLEEARNTPRVLTEEMIREGLENGREDFRGDIIFTIDGKDTKDIDDAITIKILPNGNYELGVHIADVSHYVKHGMAMWSFAELKGNSDYLGNKVGPMLPVELSNGICSLNPCEDRFTMSCVMEIDHSGKVVSKRIVKGIINSRKKMNYDAVQDIIEDKETDDTVGYDTLEYVVKEGETKESIAFSNNMTVEELLSYNEGKDFSTGSRVNIPCRRIIKTMHALSKILRAAKERRGEIEFLSDEVKIVMDETDKVTDIKAREQREAEKLIEDFMIVANETVATFIYEESLPFVYRVHETPSPKKMEDYLKFLELLGIHYTGPLTIDNVSSIQCQKLLEYLKDKENFKMLNKKLLRSMQKARYATDNTGHFGIASPCYTHFTSPIRRMSDLLVHTSLTEYLINENLENHFLESWYAYLVFICEQISERERNSEKCEYAVEDMLKADYMKEHIGEEFDATVDSLLPSSFFVQTDNFIDGRVDVIIKEKSIDAPEEEPDKMVPLTGMYDYNENLMAFTRNGRVELRYGDRVKVKCIASDPEKREIDFALVKKL